ncbi:MAG: transposase domain-containing protein [Verrucomicrobia bacterium]|nr:MAG: transposase domain-containing protein [Verrucomicrobiota bacterium]
MLIIARNHGVDPQAYLKDVIEHLPVTRTADHDALLPANWTAANWATRPLAKPLRSDAP